MKASQMVACVSAAAFLVLLGIAHLDPDDFARIDAAATALLHPFQSLPWVEYFIAITTLGNTFSILVVALAVMAFLRAERTDLLRLPLLLIATSASVEVLKRTVARLRPETLDWLGPLHSFSFPSGHAALSMAVFGFIAVALYRRTAGGVRAIALLACAGLILAIGTSRIVLAAHYASDVIAGYLLGLFWLSLVLSLPLGRRHW